MRYVFRKRLLRQLEVIVTITIIIIIIIIILIELSVMDVLYLQHNDKL